MILAVRAGAYGRQAFVFFFSAFLHKAVVAFLI